MPDNQAENDAPLTREERNAIRSLRSLAKRWPQSLMLVSMDGTLSVIRTGDERFHNIDSGDRTESVIEDFYGIPNDGGGW